MAFKTDWSFLDKISMGAVGTEAVTNSLNAMGHQVIELERYCTSNKIWATKIKRLRIPDLLCLHCGRRIESRAKSKLGIIMSDSENNAERRWFCGLRDNDWVAFIQCYRDTQNRWAASEAINLFSIGSMKATEASTHLGPPKSVFEGAERDRKWECYVPGGDGNGVISSIEDCQHNERRICMQNPDGRRQSKKVSADHYIYVHEGDTFIKGASILSGIVPPLLDNGCSAEQYDFLPDLESEEKETVYTAVKALGYLPHNDRAIAALHDICENDQIDNRIRLEAYASLLRLNENVWEEMYTFAFSLDSVELKTEYVLILGEITTDTASEYLFRVIQNEENDEEMRAAAIWSLHPTCETLSRVFPYCFRPEQIIADHAIAKVKRHFCHDLTATVLDAFCDDPSQNAICAYLLSTSDDVSREMVVNYYVSSDGIKKEWILFSIGLMPEEYYSELIDRIVPNATETKEKLELLWRCQPDYLKSTEIDRISFLEMQK